MRKARKPLKIKGLRALRTQENCHLPCQMDDLEPNWPLSHPARHTNMYKTQQKTTRFHLKSVVLRVEVAGFEPAAFWSRRCRFLWKIGSVVCISVARSQRAPSLCNRCERGGKRAAEAYHPRAPFPAAGGIAALVWEHVTVLTHSPAAGFGSHSIPGNNGNFGNTADFFLYLCAITLFIHFQSEKGN